MQKSKTAAPSAHYAMDAHHRFGASLAMAALAFAGFWHRVPLPFECILAWDVFALTALCLAWHVIVTRDPYEARRNARLQDSGATLIFSLVIFAAIASLFAVGLVLFSSSQETKLQMAGQVVVAATSVIVSWFLIHTIFALRYAHVFFDGAHAKERDDVSAGLDFPGKGSPDYLDFAYFSFIIGMTCQVSDVQINARRLRRLALVHGLIAFIFNTAILAMFVNILAGLGGK